MPTGQAPLTRSTGTEGSLLIAKTIYDQLIEAVNKKLLGRDLAAIVMGPGSVPGSSVDINLETEDSTTVVEVAEGAEIPIGVPAYSSTNIKPKKYGVRPLITKEMMEDGKFDLLAHAIRRSGKEMAENENELIEAVLDTAANTVSGGAQVTWANVVRAVQYLEDADFEATDIVMGPNVKADLMNLDLLIESHKAGSNGDVLSVLKTKSGLTAHVVSGSIYTTTSAWVLDRTQAFAIVEKRPVTIEKYDDVIHDMSGAVITQRIAMKALRTSAICKITSS